MSVITCGYAVFFQNVEDWLTDAVGIYGWEMQKYKNLSYAKNKKLQKKDEIS